MNKAKYTEALTSGGELNVTENGWYIQYYFNGPDLRYNGEFVTIQGNDVDNYIKAYKNNYKKFLELQKVIPNGGEFTTKGECNMNISCGGIYHMGITISQWYNHLSHPNCFPIKSEQNLTSVISDYEYCKLRAKEVSTLLFHK